MKGLNYNYQKNNNSQLKKNYYFNTIKNQKNQNYNIIKEIETYPLELFINLLNKTMKKTKTNITKSLNPKRQI